MFIETLEFTIPVDLCDLFSTLKRGPKSNMEFPASVNSYGTTQDANIQVVLRSNKLTFKVDGVSSDASMISKSECKNLKLSIFDVDRSLMPQEEVYDELPIVETQIPSKRAREYSAPVRSPPVKSSRTSYSDSPRNTTSNRQQNLNNSHQSQSRPSNDNSLNVKQEPEDPDCIEIEPDPEPDIVPKKESNYYSSCSGDIPHTQTSQSALERLSHPHSSHSQSPASSSSSFHQNVPHVQDYSEPGPSQMQHGDQSADDFLVFQEQDDNEDCDNDNEADFDNDGIGRSASARLKHRVTSLSRQWSPGNLMEQDVNICFVCGNIFTLRTDLASHFVKSHMEGNQCIFEDCGIVFMSEEKLCDHFASVIESELPQFCPGCSKLFHFNDNLKVHTKTCPLIHSPRSAEKIKTAQCEECGNLFASRQKRDEHVRSQHRGLKFECACGQSYSYISGLKRHMKNTGHTTPDSANNP